MKKYLLSLAVLFTGTAVAQQYKAGDLEYEVIEGEEFLLSKDEMATTFLTQDSWNFLTKHANDSAKVVFVYTGETTEIGCYLYYIQFAATGEYIKDQEMKQGADGSDLLEYKKPYIFTTTDEAQAAKWTALPAETRYKAAVGDFDYIFNWHVWTGVGTGYDTEEDVVNGIQNKETFDGAIIIMNAKFVEGRVDGEYVPVQPTYLEYHSDYAMFASWGSNSWFLWHPEEMSAMEVLENYVLEALPNGVNYVVGDCPGQYDEASVAAVEAVYARYEALAFGESDEDPYVVLEDLKAAIAGLKINLMREGYYYIELNNDGTLTIKGIADGTVRDVVIPSELNGTPVTHIAEGAFKNSDIKSIVIPASVVSVGKGAFEGCTDLVWVDWKSQADADADCFDTPEQHGNLVVFTPQEGDYAGNVVVNGVAETITLVDARPYEAPYDYVAKSITFTKRFAKTTAVGLSGGWEGVVVPFDVEYIQHGERSIAPFGGTRSDDALGCWVAELNDKGEFEMVSTIRADRPVIIAMPNSEEYDDDYNIAGDVVFSATDAQIKATPRPDLSPSQTFVLRGTYEAIEEQSKVYTLNDEIYNVLYEGDYMPGAVFVANERDVRPFEAYVFTSNPQRSATLKIGGVRPTGIETLLDIQYAPDAWYTLLGVRLNKKPAQTGFYIHGGKLEFVRQR